MPLSIGSRLGPYEILSAIGAGGMGEVYRAKDTRLDRIVAIKVLPSHLSQNPQLTQRFEREARAISSLSHPNICALHDIGVQDGVAYLVMEYLQGESLAHRLDKGPLPNEQVFKYGIQIAEALDKAHRQGIVHRDLKPGNIMITKSGAKLLDFGLAKYQVKPEVNVASELETHDKPLTEEGTILGTVQYMAPEQLEGKEADARTDIFALGEILYEMTTGRPAFRGDSKAQLMAAIISSEPPAISTVQPLAPSALDHVVRKCLAKDPDERWQSAHDVASELKWIAEAGSQPTAPIGVIPRSKLKLRLGWILATLFLITTLALCYVAYHFSQKASSGEVMKLSIVPDTSTGFTVAGNLAISPNGRFVAFAANSKDGTAFLYVRALDALEARKIPGTDGAQYPFWSPDSSMIGFFGQSKLKKVDLSGAPPQTLCDATSGRGGTWGPDGVILFAPTLSGEIYRIPAVGGTPTPVTQLNSSLQESTHRWPVFLPDGRHFLYTIHAVKSENSGLFVSAIDSKEKKRLLPDESHTEYSQDGFLLFVREGNLLVQEFDLQKLEMKGAAVPIAESIAWESTSGNTSVSVSQNGTLAYAADIGMMYQQMVWVDRQGKQTGIIGQPGVMGDFWFSPDEKKMTFYMVAARVASKPDIWLADLQAGTFSRFTFDPASEFDPVWSPDGSTIVFSSNRSGSYNIYKKSVNISSEEKELLSSKDWKFVNDWTKDGRYIVYEMDTQKTKADIWVLPLFGDRKPFPLLQSEFNEAQARVSPGGKWIAYGSDETGRSEIYVQSFPNGGGKRQISTSGGSQPSWRKDQKELFYLAPDGKMMSVEVRLNDAIELSLPVALFESRTPYIPLVGNDRNQYAASADGQRFILTRFALEANSNPITLVFNWIQLLKK